MTTIRFGTDGWRAIIAKDFTVENVSRVAEATAQWLVKSYKKPSAIVGHDCRFGGELFADTTARILAMHGIKVHLAKGPVSTPMVSLGTVRKKADLGIIIPASHNPPAYNGFKLKGSFGGPLFPEKVEEIEKLIPEKAKTDVNKTNVSELHDKGLIEYIDLESMYCDHIEQHFDLDKIRDSGLRIVYDGMFGAGQNVVKRLLPEVTRLHCDNNPSFLGRAPEPINKNLTELSDLIRNSGDFDFGFATDGDADRIGLYDHRGNFIDSHHVILLLIQYLYEVKEMRGKVVTAFSVSNKVGKMCKHYGLQHAVTKVGFKYIADIMVAEDVLLGGEESGGIAVKGHIPERDGIWVGLTLLEYMARSGKTLQQLIDDVYRVVGSFGFERSDLHLHEELKNEIVEKCKKNAYSSFGNYKIQRVETTDGYKYFFNDEEWLMIRASGTEPVLRNYAESSSSQNAVLILKAAEQALLNGQKLNS
jgi:phosphomannomutase